MQKTIKKMKNRMQMNRGKNNLKNIFKTVNK